MPAAEYAIWQEHWKRHPFGDARYFVALLVTVMANAFRGPDSRAVELEQVLWSCPKPLEEKQDQPQSVAQQKAFAEAIVAALGGSGNAV